MQKYFDFLIRGFFWLAPKPAVYIILAMWLASASERLNGENVSMELCGDWILVPTVLAAVLAVVSLYVNVMDAINESKVQKARVAAAKLKAEEAAKNQLLKS